MIGLAPLWLIPAFPLAGFLILVLTPLPPRAIAWVGTGSVGLAALATLNPILSPAPVVHQTLAPWLTAGTLQVAFGFYCDDLTRLMLGVITGVGFLIHLYSTAHMAGDEGYRRFFAAMNLFVAAMAVLVLADNLVFLYLGWEGVGLCSYLLIGHWYREPANGRAARKAFIVTRTGDTALAVGLFLLFSRLGTLDIQPLLDTAAQRPDGSWITLATGLLLAGAVGKSAQLPLQVWLPDAMAGPTPVSALIHAATMVTAGVYLVARLHPLYELAPQMQFLVAVIGAATLLLAGCSALVQHDLKRALAYSTISQIGYMFLGLGVGAWRGAAFHLMTHAFFKALLFLSAGVVILALDHERDLRAMGGLRRRLPMAFWSFLIGAAALAALPPAAGFFSKEAILEQAYAADPWLWSAGALGAFVTALYAFRLVFLVFFGPERSRPRTRSASGAIAVPLGLLSVLALLGGWSAPFPMSHPSLPPAAALAAPAVSVAGVVLAWWLWYKGAAESWQPRPVLAATGRFWRGGWGWDGLYRWLLVEPYLCCARINRGDVLNMPYDALVRLNRILHVLLTPSQSGRLRWYVMGMALGAALFIAWGFGS
ncbi:MAG: NADH-quinone oxidoreductase subunit L [Methylohalobius crimeensis]